MPTKITNKHGLPEVFFRAAQQDRHWQGGDYSVTQLIDSPQIRILKRKNHIEEDVMDRLWMMFGTGMHKVMEMASAGSSVAVELFTAAAAMAEVRLMMAKGELDQEIAAAGIRAEDTDAWLEKTAGHIKRLVNKLWPGAYNDLINCERRLSFDMLGKTISGTVDRYVPAEKMIEDYKFMKVYGAMSDDTIKKYSKQLNLYAFALRENGEQVEKARLLIVLKDWSASQVGKKQGYPETPIMVVDVKIHPQDKLRPWVESLVQEHMDADAGEVRECTKEEMWERPGIYKVKKHGRKNALPGGTFDNLKAANLFIEQFDGKIPASELYVEETPGQRARCTGFCPVSHVCPQHQNYLAEHGLIQE